MGAKLSGPAGQAGGATRHNADINVTPFVDIMLVLLIIFMVAAPMATVSLRLDLPPAKDPGALAPNDPVYVTVQASGRLFIGDRETTLPALAGDVCAALGGGACREERIFLRAEPETAYDRFMTVMTRLNAEGFHQVGLLNEDIE
jgi:biopolymer transport protein ExbD